MLSVQLVFSGLFGNKIPLSSKPNQIIRIVLLLDVFMTRDVLPVAAMVPYKDGSTFLAGKPPPPPIVDH